MAAYLVLVLAILSRMLPHVFHATGVGFTAVGGGLLYFGARRSRWHWMVAVLTLMATDFYLTVYAYGYAFHVSEYVATWAWYGAACWLGYAALARKVSGVRLVAAVVASTTSFFLLSNFVVWMASGMYPRTGAGLGACYVAGLPFYANDAISTGLVAGALFGLPALARDIAASVGSLRDEPYA